MTLLIAISFTVLATNFRMAILKFISTQGSMSTVNCKEECVNGCILGDKCPHLEYLATARKFIAEHSVDRMIEIADSRFNPPAQDKEDR